MKKITTIFSLLVFGGSLVAQNAVIKTKEGHTTPVKQQTLPAIEAPVSKTTKSAAAGPGDIIYYFDFATGIPTGWSTTGTPSAALWEYRGPSTNPTNATGSRGAFAGTTGPIASSSAANGFMIFDSDYLDNTGNPSGIGTGVAPADPVSGHFGNLVTAPLDFSSYPNVTFQCESYMRVFASAAWVLFSYDGGLTFTDTLLLHGDLAINTRSDNAVTYKFNISNFVGGKSNVVVNFMFDGSNPLGYNANGMGYYYWQIDDIAFIETPNSDLELADQAVTHGTKLGVYGSTPLAEVVPVLYTGLIQNIGSQDQPNTRLEAIYSSNGVQVGSEITLAGTLLVASDTIVEGTTGYTPSTTGDYEGVITALSDSVDFDMSNNSYTNTFTVTDSTYALDNGTVTSFMGTNTFTGGEDGFQMLNIYEFSQPFQMNSVYIPLSSATNVGGSMFIVVYDSTGATYGGGGQFVNQTSPNYKSEQHIITVADSIKGYVKIKTDFTIPAGGYYVGVELYSNGGADVIRLGLDETVNQNPYASLIYILGSGLYTNPEAVHMRLNYSTADDPCNTVSIDVSGTINDSNLPDPYTGSISGVTATGGTAPYLFSWTGPGGFTSNLQNISGLSIKGDYIAVATDAEGCTGSEVFTVAGMVGTVELENNQKLSIFPNPSEGTLNISFNQVDGGNFQVSVRNVIGQVVYNSNVIANANTISTLNLNNLDKGVYFLTVVGNDVEFTERVVIK